MTNADSLTYNVAIGASYIDVSTAQIFCELLKAYIFKGLYQIFSWLSEDLRFFLLNDCYITLFLHCLTLHH